MAIHAIVTMRDLWFRVVGVVKGERVVEELDNSIYQFAFLEHFFPGKYRIEARKVNDVRRDNLLSEGPYEGDIQNNEAIRFSNAGNQYRVFIDEHNGWLAGFETIGLVIKNSRKMAKRLIELVRATAMWEFTDQLKIEYIDHKAHGLRDTDVDGISAVSVSQVLRCINNNTSAGHGWRSKMKKRVLNGEIAVLSLRILTPQGEVKGNALIVPDSKMKGYDVRTVGLNVKPELGTTGWYWITLDTTYGINPTKSDDMSHAIFRQVYGLYDDDTLLGSLKGMLAHTFDRLKAGELTKEYTALADADSNILHREDEVKFRKGLGRVARIQLALAEMSAAGIPITASQTMMFMYVNGLKMQLLSTETIINEWGQRVPKFKKTWHDKDRHWVPVPWAFTAHIMTREALELYGFKMPSHSDAFVHARTHTFVVSGDYFALHYANHGGFDLDDSIKVHIRRVKFSDGQVKLMAILVRDPVDFGEWSMTTIDESVIDHVYHKYTDEAPLVVYEDLIGKVPQFTELRKSIPIGKLPHETNPVKIGNVFSPLDEERVRELSNLFPAGTGGTVTPKMLWYATFGTHLPELPATNEALIDVLQQGLGTADDIKYICEWSERVFDDIRNHSITMDAFWWKTRLPYHLKKQLFLLPGEEGDSSWVKFHERREKIVNDYLGEMTKFLNGRITKPEALGAIKWTTEEVASAKQALDDLNSSYKSNPSMWATRFVDMLITSDKEKGEQYTDRKILLMANQAFVRKAETNWNSDQWLYPIDHKLEKLPYEWFVRAMTRIQDGTYAWIPDEFKFMDETLVDEIRKTFKDVRDNLDEDRARNLIDIMKGHVNGLRPKSVKWAHAALKALRSL